MATPRQYEPSRNISWKSLGSQNWDPSMIELRADVQGLDWETLMEWCNFVWKGESSAMKMGETTGASGRGD
jgi:hypothetical protein